MISNILCILVTVLIVSSNSFSLDDLTSAHANIPEDGRLKFCELAKKYGYECTRYNVTTEDGYILGLYNIPGDKLKPIFLQHGILDSADTFLVRTTASMVAFLAGQDYDIWLGNMRGNKYSKAHETLDPNDLKFWDFSIHEIAIYDMPAMIDFILAKTEQSQLPIIGHSEGTTVTFAMGATKPEYNDKVKFLVCLAPIVHMQHSAPFTPASLAVVVPAIPPVQPYATSGLADVLSKLGHGEIFANSSAISQIAKVLCPQLLIGYDVCIEVVSNYFSGRDSEQLEPEFLPVLVGHFPSGTSTKNFIHILQLASRKNFTQYDYGWLRNNEIYNQREPPTYDLSKVTMRVVLVVGLSDKTTDLKDINILRHQLPNVVDYHIMERKEWNHVDYIWGRNMTMLFDYIDLILNKYN